MLASFSVPEADEGLTFESIADEGILVLEDDPSSQTAIRLALRRRGLTQISLADDLPAARDLYRQLGSSVSCAIIDANLPSGSGLELAREIAMNDPRCGQVLLTGRWDDAVINGAMAVPMHAFGHKPFDVDGPAGLVLRAIAVARGLRERPDQLVGSGDDSLGEGLSRSLTAQQRTIVSMRLAKRSYADIGVALEIGVETVRSHLKRARKRMGGAPGEDLQATVDRAVARMRQGSANELG